MSTSHRVIIVGGGIAGPALALFLQRAGLDARVFEAYPPSDGVGGGFQIAPNGVRVLEALGLAAPVAAGGCAAEGFVFRNHRGRIIATMRTDRSGKAITTLRAPFYRTLLDAVARAGIAVEYGKRLVDVAEEGAGVVARFADGSSVSGDVLVGADGVHSRVRALLWPEHAQPRYTGLFGIGGLVPGGVAVPDAEADARTLNFIMGPRLSFGYALMGGAERRWGWWCHFPQAEELGRAEVQAIPDEELRARLTAAFAGWCDPVAPFLAATPRILRTPIYEVPELPAWSRGAVGLIGDAAHAMSPAAGQGASLALEDAMLLAHLLSAEAATAAGAFAELERRRRRRVASIASTARDNDERSLKPLGGFGCWMRDRMFPLFAPLIARALDKQYAAEVV